MTGFFLVTIDLFRKKGVSRESRPCAVTVPENVGREREGGREKPNITLDRRALRMSAREMKSSCEFSTRHAGRNVHHTHSRARSLSCILWA